MEYILDECLYKKKKAAPQTAEMKKLAVVFGRFVYPVSWSPGLVAALNHLILAGFSSLTCMCNVLWTASVLD